MNAGVVCLAHAGVGRIADRDVPRHWLAQRTGGAASSGWISDG
jgi:hypothetical protein